MKYDLPAVRLLGLSTAALAGAAINNNVPF